jgi:DNA polymerase-3 subunit gamma/tau
MDTQDDVPLHLKYRPQAWKEVLGQDQVVRSLEQALKKSVPHAFLFVGPSGCGKTTLARILAGAVGSSPEGVMEVDGASLVGDAGRTGSNAIRQLLENLRYRALAESPIKFVILDECHALSKAAWQPLLKAVEEPPAHVYWALCTTEVDKVPQTIKTRCQTYNVRSVPPNDLFDYLEKIARKEKLSVDPDIIQACVKESGGSVRQALVNLNATRACADAREAQQLLAGMASNEGDVIKFVKMLVEGRLTWPAAVQHIEALVQTESAESVRLVTVNYTAKVLLGTKDERKAQKLLAVLDAFDKPFYGNEKAAPLLLAVGRLLFT